MAKLGAPGHPAHVREAAINMGRYWEGSQASLAATLGLSIPTIERWLREAGAQKGDLVGKPAVDVHDENARLVAENEKLKLALLEIRKMTFDILGDAC